MSSAEESRQDQENNQKDGNVTVNIPEMKTVLKPSSEAVKMVMEYFVNDPEMLLECRLVSSDFRKGINKILEERWLSLWNWNCISGETDSCFPIKRKLQCLKNFQHPSEVNSFMETMGQYSATGMSPFPNGGVYFRAVRPIPRTTGANIDGNALENVTEIEGCTLSKLDENSITLYNANYDDNFNERHVISVAKIIQFLDKLGKYVKSLIWECGVNTNKLSLGDIAAVLEKTPNITHLFLKDIQVEISGHSLPKLGDLISIELIGCRNVCKPILQSYYGQLITFQLTNPLNGWFSAFDWIQIENDGAIFRKLVELKLDGIDKGHGFDSLETFFQKQQEIGYPFHNLERLAIGYKFYPQEMPAKTLLSLLRFFPKLVEIDMGKHYSTQFSIKLVDELAQLESFTPFPSLRKVHLPLKFLEYSSLVWKILQKLPNVKEVTFVHSDNLFGFQQIPWRPEDCIKLPRNVSILSLLELVLNGAEHLVLVKMSVVSFVKSDLREMCVVKKTTE